jgi:hypothetical protein
MPHGNHDALLRRVVALAQPLASKTGLFAAMVMDGQIVDSSIVMQGIIKEIEMLCPGQGKEFWDSR